MSHLNFRDIKTATETCYYWYILVQKSPSLKTKLIPKIKLKQIKLEPYNKDVITIMNSKREFISIKLQSVSWNEIYEDFWIHIGHNITHLEIVNCRISLYDFYNIVKYLPLLKFLDLSNNTFQNFDINNKMFAIAQEMVESYLMKLDGLKVGRMPKEIFLKLFKWVSNLTTFVFEYSQDLLYEGILLDFIEKNKHTLDHLALLYDKSELSLLSQIADFDHLNLKKFETNNSNFHIDILEKLCLRFPNIVKLKLHDISATHLKCVIRCLPELKRLSVDQFDDDMCWNELQSLKNVESLHLYNIGDLEENILIKCLKTIDCKMLTSFLFEGRITDGDIEWIAKNCINLTELKLSCMRPIPLIGIQKIFNYLVKLEVLVISQWTWFYVSNF